MAFIRETNAGQEARDRDADPTSANRRRVSVHCTHPVFAAGAGNSTLRGSVIRVHSSAANKRRKGNMVI